ncbi:hypothetical protein ACHAW6_005972 [Cyclotella cf. meneghiniana]
MLSSTQETISENKGCLRPCTSEGRASVSGWTFHRPQQSLRASDTIRGKQQFEQFAAEFDISIKKFHTNNGVFRSDEFKAHVHANKQKISFSGVGAHHQNGVAERAIRTMCEMARASMLHAQLCWPGRTTVDLWPLAMSYVIWVHNRLPPNGADDRPIVPEGDVLVDDNGIVNSALPVVPEEDNLVPEGDNPILPLPGLNPTNPPIDAPPRPPAAPATPNIGNAPPTLPANPPPTSPTPPQYPCVAPPIAPPPPPLPQPLCRSSRTRTGSHHNGPVNDRSIPHHCG